MIRSTLLVLGLTLLGCSLSLAGEGKDAAGVVYEGGDGPGKGKHIVFVTGDDEYRSEEGMPMMAKILAKKHGFKCTVLFAIHKETGEIDPTTQDNIPGLEALKTADLMVIFTRFRDLPDEQMKHVVAYVESGKPIVGLRTATHAFNIKKNLTNVKYSWDYSGADYTQGFGRQILGETWISHHGAHGSQSARGILAPDATDHPILRGIKDGDIWGPSDVYGVRLPLPGDSKPLVMGQVVAGMKKDDKPVEGPKNSPMMPVAWTKTYKGKDGQVGRVFCTTMGAATDLESEGLRRLLVNACYWALGMEGKITDKLDVAIIGDYKPSNFSFNGHKKGVKPADLR